MLARFDPETVAAVLRTDEEIRPILEDSIWTQARVVGLTENLLQRIGELEAMLAETDLD